MTPQTHLDAILVERIRLGDPSAIDELLHKYYGKAFKHALKLTKQADEADDVVADSFVRIHRAIGQFQENSSFTTWMFKILRNCFLDRRKKRCVNVVCSLDASMEMEDSVVFFQPVDLSESSFDKSAKAEHSEQVQSVLAQLPTQQRELLNMYYQEELSYREISRRLQSPAGTIKSRLNRAKANMKGLLQQDTRLPSMIDFAS